MPFSEAATMKRLIIALLAAVFLLASCAAPSDAPTGEPAACTPEAPAGLDKGAFESALADWIAGTDYGIRSGGLSDDSKTVLLNIPEEAMDKMTGQDRQDIETAVRDILRTTLDDPKATDSYGVQFAVDAAAPQASVLPGESPLAAAEAAPGETVNLIFIHHSCGENWLNDGLCAALNQSGFHVADIYYGWREYGDRTDTSDWPTWFTDKVMGLVYGELGAMTAPNAIEPAPGENTVVMFKSCFPNSDVGDSIEDEKAVYDSLLPYFEKHPDKMFVLCTPPPMIHISNPLKTRELCGWLTDRENGWLKGLSTGNVFTFDLYNVLTHPDAHHMLRDGKETHITVPGSDELYYDSDGDDHPNAEGNVKAAGEFMGLLNFWYREFRETR
jgi:hypothetical protein